MSISATKTVKQLFDSFYGAFWTMACLYCFANGLCLLFDKGLCLMVRNSVLRFYLTTWTKGVRLNSNIVISGQQVYIFCKKSRWKEVSSHQTLTRGVGTPPPPNPPEFHTSRKNSPLPQTAKEKSKRQKIRQQPQEP
ncbi:MAG: hypothetical protein FD143_3765 [Ignavibacteria bacterium]|nr:MAG: hypothetical protein FD143_3765 [Ignavibacteria bacterium]